MLTKEKCFENLMFIKEKLSVKVDLGSIDEVVLYLSDISVLTGMVSECIYASEYYYQQDKKDAANCARRKFADSLESNLHYRMNSLMSASKRGRNELGSLKYQEG